MSKPKTDLASETPGVLYDISIADPRARIQAYLDAYLPQQHQQPDVPETFDSALLSQHLQISSITLSADPNKPSSTVTFTLTVPQSFCNRTNNLHGGAASLIVDMCTTLAQAPLAKPGYWEFGGVSRTLSLTFLRPVKRGMTVLIVCEVVQVGRTMATIQCRIVRKSDGVVCVMGEHGKSMVDIERRMGKL